MTNKKFCLDVYRIAFCFNEIVQTAVFIENEVTNESMIFKIILQSTTFILDITRFQNMIIQNTPKKISVVRQKTPHYPT